MGRRIEEKYDLGTYTVEFVEKMKPLEEDRKTVFLPDTAAERLVEFGGATLGIFLANIMKALEAKFGDEVWEVADKAAYDIGRNRAAGMARVMKIDPTDARSLGRIHDMENNGMGIKCEWIETGKKRAVGRIFACPLAKPAKESPKICSVIMEAMERGTFDALGVKIKKPVLTKLMPQGDSYCEVTDELED